MKKRLVICDRDERYRQMMQAYFMKRLRDFEILTFESLLLAAEYSVKQPFAILLVSEQLYEIELHKIQAMQIFILREDGAKAVTEYPYIEKYQSMEHLIRDILAEYSQGIISNFGVRSKKTAIHAFYSPVRKQEQTKAAVAFGQVLTKMDRKVLYLNLQPFAGWEELFETSFPSDITDLLYFLRKKDSNCTYRLQSIKQRLGGMDYLAPATDYMDVLTITKQEWLVFLDTLAEMGEYDDMILDLSEICQSLYCILEQSNSIYSISGVTQEERNSVNQYTKLLKRRELTSILNRTNWLEPPKGDLERISSLERLYATKLGEYMKGFVRENGNK